MGTYRIAQVCLNGHLITDSADVHPENKENFCSKCSAKTITNCPNCNDPIPGYYDVPGVFSFGETSIPRFCRNCGNPYPWTETALEAARTLINEDENLSSDDKQKFSETLPDLIVESPTPKTQLAATRFKRFLSKSVSYTAEGLREIIVDIASESIKKSLGF